MTTPPASERESNDDQQMAALMEWSRQTSEIARELMESDPTLNYITAQVMAGDILSARKMSARVADEDADPTDLYVMVGSYARWGWVVGMVKAGKISDEWFAENIADLWRGADPDDTDPDNLALWRRVYNAHGAVIRDGRPLPPPGGDGNLKVFRGGSPFTVKNGFAWTLDPKIARKFATTMGGRAAVSGGVVVTGYVKPSDVLAYLTERGESEVSVDPRRVRDIHPTGA